MLRRRRPPLLTLRPAPIVPPPLPLALPPAPVIPPRPPPPRPQRPTDLQLGGRSRSSSSTFQYCKRFLQHCHIMRVRFGDYYEEWMKHQMLHAQTVPQFYLSADMDVRYAVEQELKRYNKYYTVSMMPTKPLHVSEMVMPNWKPHLENAFMWLGDWRPSAILSFLLLCHDTRVIRLPPHHVSFVKELLRISHANETILDEDFAACQAMSPIHPAATDADSLPALLLALPDKASGFSHVREDVVLCMGRNLMRMNSVVAKAQNLRFEAIEAVANRLLKWKDAAHFFLVLARFQAMFHATALSRMKNLG